MRKRVLRSLMLAIPLIFEDILMRFCLLLGFLVSICKGQCSSQHWTFE